MKISREYGGWITTSLSFLLVIIYSLNIKLNLSLIIFWIPVFAGLALFDLNLKEMDKTSDILIFVGIIFSVFSIILYCYIIIPYLLFFISYLFKHKRYSNYLVTLTGLSGQVFMVFLSLHFSGINFTENSILLFLYLYGAEFAVKSFIKKKFSYSLYNLIPFALSIIFTHIFIISIFRLSYFKFRKIKSIGIMETILYSVIVIYFIFISFLQR